MNIVLIGYRASGKSTIGKILAEQLSLEFVDIDLEIMARYDNKTVAEIWQQFGEPDYRATECDVTELTCKRDNQVIALGGGTPMQARAYDALVGDETSTRFFLQAPADILFQRSNIDTKNADNRPSLTQTAGGLEEVKQMLKRREPTYKQLAHHVIDASEQSLAAAAQEIIRIVTSN